MKYSNVYIAKLRLHSSFVKLFSHYDNFVQKESETSIVRSPFHAYILRKLISGEYK